MKRRTFIQCAAAAVVAPPFVSGCLPVYDNGTKVLFHATETNTGAATVDAGQGAITILSHGFEEGDVLEIEAGSKFSGRFVVTAFKTLERYVGE